MSQYNTVRSATIINNNVKIVRMLFNQLLNKFWWTHVIGAGGAGGRRVFVGVDMIASNRIVSDDCKNSGLER